MQSCNMPGLPTDSVQELNVDTVHFIARHCARSPYSNCFLINYASRNTWAKQKKQLIPLPDNLRGPLTYVFSH